MSRKKRSDETQSAENMKWETQEDLRTLERADEIRRSGDRMSRAKAEAKRQMDALGKVAKSAPKGKKQAVKKPLSVKKGAVKRKVAPRRVGRPKVRKS